MKNTAFGLLCASLLLLPGSAAVAQDQAPTIHTFVAEWNIPRDQWGAYLDFNEKSIRPVLERLSSDGTLIGWGNFATVVHSAGGPTHGTWFTANSVAEIEKARLELIQVAGSPVTATAPHWDFLLRSDMYGARSAGPTSGYLYVNTVRLRPGKVQDWEDLWNKYSKPIFEQLVSDGTLLAYLVDVEDVHTDNPYNRYVVTVSPSADAEDKMNAAFEAAAAQRSEEERRAIGDAFTAATDREAHRDYFAQVISYWHK